MNNRLKNQVEFIMEVDKLKGIIRKNRITVDDRNENDAEHSWHLVMISQLLIEYVPEEIDLLKVIKILTIHDLVEIDAGDTFAFDEQGYIGKFDRELEAAKRIFGILPEDQAKELLELWLEFEDATTAEGKYALAIDKIHPFILNSHTGGKSWIENNVTKTQVLKRMSIIKEVSDELWSYFLELLDSAISRGLILDN